MSEYVSPYEGTEQKNDWVVCGACGASYPITQTCDCDKEREHKE